MQPSVSRIQEDTDAAGALIIAAIGAQGGDGERHGDR
jgi:hypothetical protein